MRRIFAALIAFVILCFAAAAVSAHEVPDPSRNGTITFTMSWMGEPLNGGNLTMYRVGQIAEDNGNYTFVPVDELQGLGLSLEDPNDQGLAKKLAEYAVNRKLTALSAEIKDGRAVFTDVVPGLYVVVQNAGDVTEGFAAISPFLISMPRNEGGHYETDVVAAPKVPIETEPPPVTEPEPTEPSGGTLPQTGQLRWPVSVLALAGLVFAAVGWRLRFGQEKDS